MRVDKIWGYRFPNNLFASWFKDTEKPKVKQMITFLGQAGVVLHSKYGCDDTWISTMSEAAKDGIAMGKDVADSRQLNSDGAQSIL